MNFLLDDQTIPFEIVTFFNFVVTVPAGETVYKVPAPLGAPNPIVPTHKCPAGSHLPSLQRTLPFSSGIGAMEVVWPSCRFTRTISSCKAMMTVLSVSGTTVDTIRSNFQELHSFVSG